MKTTYKVIRRLYTYNSRVDPYGSEYYVDEIELGEFESIKECHYEITDYLLTEYADTLHAVMEDTEPSHTKFFKLEDNVYRFCFTEDKDLMDAVIDFELVREHKGY